jgi:hypothetical protein
VLSFAQRSYAPDFEELLSTQTLTPEVCGRSSRSRPAAIGPKRALSYASSWVFASRSLWKPLRINQIKMIAG